METPEVAQPQATQKDVEVFVHITDKDGQLGIQTNIPPQMAPLVLWLIKRAELTILTQKPKEESKIQPVQGSLNGFLKKMRL